jgi:hypothetical protein
MYSFCERQLTYTGLHRPRDLCSRRVAELQAICSYTFYIGVTDLSKPVIACRVLFSYACSQEAVLVLLAATDTLLTVIQTFVFHSTFHPYLTAAP